MMRPETPKINSGRLVKGILGIVVALVLFIMSFSMFEHLSAQQYMVVQAPFSGKLTWHLTQGVKFQWFGKVTKYNKSFQYWFSNRDDQGGGKDQSIQVRFNDAGHAKISGSVRIDLPPDPEKLTNLHVKYGSQDAVEGALIRTNYEKAMYMTGPLLSSRESYAEKRSNLIAFIEDQAMNGVYQTINKDIKGKDSVTGVEKTVTIVELVKDPKSPSGIARQEESPFKQFGIKSFAFSINNVAYDKTVDEQIASQQKATMQIQTAVVKAKEAEQEKLTVEAKGAADAARAKWAQEVIKATEVTAAEQRVQVARLDADAAALKKKKDILEGEGEGEKKRLIMSADGALEQKLRAYIEVNKMYADAMAKYQGAWVPGVVMGGAGGGAGRAGGGATDLIDMLSVKTARDLSLDMGFAGAAATKKK